MLDKVKNTIKKYSMLSSGDTVCVGVSGGADSMTLLDVLYRLKDEFRLNLVVCHLNHNLRGKESLRDFNFVKSAAMGLGLKFEGKTLGLKEAKGKKRLSLQAWAREKRLVFLLKAAKKHGAKKIALGHTLDDQAETVLMRFISGSGLKGLMGISPVRGPFIRPLIEIPRSEIEKYAKGRGIKYVVDSSNLKPVYLRNSVRLKLIPFIEKNYNPNLKAALARIAAILKRDEEYLGKIAEGAYASALKSVAGNTVVMDRKKLSAFPAAIASRVFLKAASIVKRVEKEEYSHQVEIFLDIIRGEKPNAVIKLHEGFYLLREYDTVKLSSVKPALPRKLRPIRLKVPGVTELKAIGAGFKATVLKGKPETFKGGNIAFFDFEKLKPSTMISVRTFRPGDRMRLMGVGGHKKLKEIFIEAKVPPSKRPLMPLLTAGDEIIWAPPLKQSESFKVVPRTKKTLMIEFYPLRCPVLRVRGR